MPQAGCSWLVVSKPPAGPVEPTAELDCTSSRAAPIADTVGAVIFAAIAVPVLYDLIATGCGKEPGEPQDAICAALGFPALGLATVYGFSAGYGYKHTGRCADLVMLKNACVRGDAAACSKLSTWQGP
jgi:hypothetical protein